MISNARLALVAVIAHFAGNHFDRHADFNRLVVYIGKLGGDHRSFVQFDEGDGVRRSVVKATRGFVDSGIRIHFAFAAKRIEFLRFVAAVRADVARGKDLVIAMGTDFSDQSIALFLKSPMSWNFHNPSSFLQM